LESTVTSAKDAIGALEDRIATLEQLVARLEAEVRDKPSSPNGIRLCDLELSTRAFYGLKLLAEEKGLTSHAAIKTILKDVSAIDILRTPNLGKKTLAEIQDVLKYNGFPPLPR
jgi:DNA-directed RNA polymerase alpha subunit